MYGAIAMQYQRFISYIKWLYLLYELNTQISIMEPWEKVFCNVLLGSCITILVYISYAFLPGYCQTLLELMLPAAPSISNNNELNVNSVLSAETFIKSI